MTVQGAASPLLLEDSIGECLSRTALQYSCRPALVDGDVVWSWSRVEILSDEIACFLLKRGIGRGSHVGLWSVNTPALVLCFLAVVKLGAVAVLLNPGYRLQEAAYALEYADVKFLLVGEGTQCADCESIRATLTASRDLPQLREVISIESVAAHTDRPDSVAGDAAGIGCGELAAAKKAVCPHDTAAILFTSGTTASPKGAVISHRSLVNNALALACGLQLTAADRCCLALPLFHCFSLASNLLAGLQAGAALVFPQNRHSGEILRTVTGQRCTVLHAVPTLLRSMALRADIAEHDLSSLRVGILGGAPISPDQAAQIRKKLGYRILPSLGQTEATAGITLASYDAPADVCIQTVGRFLPGIEARIDSAAGGEGSGEICIRGYSVMQGYYRPDVDGTAVDADGWLHTGDLGYLREDGNLCLTGRKKEIIIRGGENISPVELETCIAQHPAVQEVKCIGVPDAHFGEEVCACVVCERGMSLTEADIRELVRENLAAYKVPRHVLFVGAFEYTSSGKIALPQLRAQIQRTLSEKEAVHEAG